MTSKSVFLGLPKGNIGNFIGENFLNFTKNLLSFGWVTFPTGLGRLIDSFLDYKK
jgi:hypothetical protein